MKISLSFFVIVILVSTAAGCCTSHFKKNQLANDIHTYCLDGDPEALSEAEPDNAI